MNTQHTISFEHQRFTVLEAAKHLRISKALLYKLIAAGKLTPSKLGNRTIISGVEIQRLLQNKEH
jgi:excisionase family DNA binding protein